MLNMLSFLKSHKATIIWIINGLFVLFLLKPDFLQLMFPPSDLEGQWIAFTCVYNPGRDSRTSLYIVKSDGSELRELIGKTKNDHLSSPDWSPDGEWIVFGGGNNIQFIRGNGTGRNKIKQAGGYPSWSPDSQEIAFKYLGSIYTFNVDTEEYQSLASHRGNVSAPVWSPDGKWIAYSSYKTLYLIGHDGDEQIELVSFETEIGNPEWWSSDGKWIMFGASDNNMYSLHRIGIDGIGLERIGGYADIRHPSSPDGEWLAFTSYSRGIGEIYKMKPDGSDLQQLASIEECNPATSLTWSPVFERTP
jgi:TolB protein